jgi:recombination protein RecA
LARATANGLGALIERTGTSLYPPALAEAGVALERLLVIPAPEPLAALRAADIVLRSGAFGVVAIPAVPLKAEAWTRLASLAHRTNALVVALGAEASDELRYFASVRVRARLTHVRWSGGSGPFATLAGFDVRFEIVKHKRAAPGKSATVRCATFEVLGPSLAPPRERVLRFPDADPLRVRSVV